MSTPATPGLLRRIAFVGIGNIGWPMAANLLKAGFDVVTCHVIPDRATKFVAEVGGNAADDVASAG